MTLAMGIKVPLNGLKTLQYQWNFQYLLIIIGYIVKDITDLVLQENDYLVCINITNK